MGECLIEQRLSLVKYKTFPCGVKKSIIDSHCSTGLVLDCISAVKSLKSTEDYVWGWLQVDLLVTICTDAVSTSAKKGGEEMLSWITFCLTCSFYKLTVGQSQTNEILSFVHRIPVLACNFSSVYLKTNQINPLDHQLHLHQHLFKLFIKFYGWWGKNLHSPRLIGTTVLEPVYYS